MKKVWIVLIAIACLAAAVCVPMAARVETDVVMIFNADARFGGFTLDTKEMTEGSGSVSVKLSGDSFVASYNLKDTVDITGCDTVAFDMYIDDVEAFREGVRDVFFELSSSGTCDKDELQWSVGSSIKEMNLEDGWNTVYMDIGVATEANDFDETEVNYLRFYTFHGGVATGLVIKLDNIRACVTGGEDFSDMKLDAYQRDNSDVDIIIEGQPVPDLDNRDADITKTVGFKK